MLLLSLSTKIRECVGSPKFMIRSISLSKRSPFWLIFSAVRHILSSTLEQDWVLLQGFPIFVDPTVFVPFISLTPSGVWTLEKEGKKPTFNKSFIEARPSIGHLALVALENAGYINFVITQNIDGLHLRSGFPRNRLSILHGDVFIEKCSSCGANYVRTMKIVPTFGQKATGSKCTKMKTRVRPCGWVK